MLIISRCKQHKDLKSSTEQHIQQSYGVLTRACSKLDYLFVQSFAELNKAEIRKEFRLKTIPEKFKKLQ
ncbi:hypothetical protein SRABI27_00234 [Pedobacter sp. Bi27]|nr:hypothetical protein SRABI27_00234 [Pedobacter sp. Bi27]